MIRYIYFSIATFLLFVACKNEEKVDTELVIKREQKYSDTLETQEIPALKGDLTENLLIKFGEQKKLIEKQFKSSTKLHANDLYESYYSKNEELLNKLMTSESKILNSFYNDDTASKNLLKIKKNQLAQYDIEFDEIGEGLVELKTKPDFYYTIFKDYVTDDYRDYLAILKMENSETYSVDAGLVVPFDEVGNRIAEYERFMKKYPKTKLMKKVRASYKYYQQDFLLGMDNTPTIEHADPDKLFIYEENLDAFKKFKYKYPASPTNKLIDFFLQNFKNENVHEIISEEQDKLFGPS